MLDFRIIDIGDKLWICDLLKLGLPKEKPVGCEYSFANNLAWQRLSNSKIARFGDFYVVASENNSFIEPVGVGNYDDVFSEMKNYTESINIPLKITNVLDTSKYKKYGEFDVIDDPGAYDYIYLSEDLKNLSGKKYAKKRNHLNRFYEYDWEYKPLIRQYFNECIAFAALTYNQKEGFNERGSVVEQYAIDKFFQYYEEMNLQGGTLWVDGMLVAFTIGEQLNNYTFCIHIEKANLSYHGSFAAINREFAARNINCKYINREEDMGILGLRKSKNSYFPVMQLEKKTVIFH